MALRLLVYDRTQKDGERLLRAAWAQGARVYRALGRVDAHHGATSWEDALAWLASHRADEPIAKIQFWGHGKWGRAFIGSDAFSSESLSPSSAHAKSLEAIRARMLADEKSLLWFRTCETLGARAGHDFSARLADHLGARVAGHTFVIAALQSGLHGLAPGQRPHWSAGEGLEKGTPEAPETAYWSSPGAPNTIHFMNDEVPAEWFGPSRR
jgi:hypothetical protein